MSFRTVVVPEDPTNNGYILKPLVEAVLAACGKPNARVMVLGNPRTQGYEHAKGLLRTELLDRYKFVDLLLFLPDGDGSDKSNDFGPLEDRAHAVGTKLICCAAREEVETWLLAGHVEKLGRPWPEIRTEVSVKENVFEPFLRQNGDQRQPGGGREQLMRHISGKL